MNNALTTNMKTLVNNNKTAYDVVYNGVNHNQRKSLAEMVEAMGIKTIKQFIKFDFEAYDISLAKRMALAVLQEKLSKYMSKVTPVAKKKTAKKVVAKKVKPVAKKKTAKQTILDKYTKQYSIVTNYSESLLQDVYSVIYKGNVLKRFVNENLATKYIGQEVLVKVGEHNIRTAKKTKALNAELAAEFEG